jgi:hypothetical protein
MFKYFIVNISYKCLLLQFQHVNKFYHTCTYNLLPEDEPSGSKHVEDIAKIKKLV